MSTYCIIYQSSFINIYMTSKSDEMKSCANLEINKIICGLQHYDNVSKYTVKYCQCHTCKRPLRVQLCFLPDACVHMLSVNASGCCRGGHYWNLCARSGSPAVAHSVQPMQRADVSDLLLWMNDKKVKGVKTVFYQMSVRATESMTLCVLCCESYLFLSVCSTWWDPRPW